MNNRLTLLICFILLAVGSAFADQPLQAQKVYLEPDEIMMSSLDSPQPDTIAYDIESSTFVYFQTLANYWFMVRFTPTAAFTLRSVYFPLVSTGGSTIPCSTWVYTRQADNRPGTLLAWAGVATIDQGFNPYDLDLNDTLEFAANESFMVIVGRAPGYSAANGWAPVLSEGNPASRSYYNTTNRTTAYTAITPPANPYNHQIRVGGSYASFTNLKADECYNTTSTGPSYFVPAGEDINLHALIKNPSTVDVAAFTVTWNVTGPAGTAVYSDEAVGNAIESRGGSQIVDATGSFPATDLGEYLVTCVVNATGDADASDDTTRFRFFAQPTHDAWYRYDDNSAESSMGYPVDTKFGVAFTPTYYSAKIKSLRINFAEWTGPADAQLDILPMTSAGPGTTSLWNTIIQADTGWNTVVVSPPVKVFLGQSFLVSFTTMDANGPRLAVDGNDPNVARISSMGTIAWQNFGTWDASISGNASIQAFVDSSDAKAPYPLFAHVNDTIFFGRIDTTGNCTGRQPLRMTNLGHDTTHMRVSNMAIFPVANRTAFSFSPTSITILGGDTGAVEVRFNPIQNRVYNGYAVITNNSNNLHTDTVYYRAEGCDTCICTDPVTEIIGSLPVQYTLSQNFPNPFNPTTEIQFSLPINSSVKLTVFNILGQEVALLAEGDYSAGLYKVTFDASQLSSGLYFYKLEAGSFTALNKMMLMK